MKKTNTTLGLFTAIILSLFGVMTVNAQTFFSPNPHDEDYGVKKLIGGEPRQIDFRDYLNDPHNFYLTHDDVAPYILPEGIRSTEYGPAQWWGQNEVAKHGPYWLFKPMAYDFSAPVIRQVYVSTSQPWPTWLPYQYPALSAYPDYIPVSQQANAGMYAETTLVGQGIDSLFLGPLSTSFNMGWSVMVKILDQNYQELQTHILFQNVVPSVPPVLTVTDPAIGGATLITFNINVQQAYAYGSSATPLTQKVKARLWAQGGGYDVTYEWILPTGPGPIVASFTIPFGLWQQGVDLCLEVTYEVSHNPSTPKYWNGSLVVWRYLPPCFYHGLSTDMEEFESTTLSAFPNPFTDQLVVTAPKAAEYQIFGARGELVDTGRLMPGENRLSLPGLAPGVYILRTDDGYFTRLVKE